MRDKTIISTKKSEQPRRGRLSPAVMARLRSTLRRESLLSKKAVPRWLVLASLLLTAAIVFAALIGQESELAGPGASARLLLNPVG